MRVPMSKHPRRPSRGERRYVSTQRTHALLLVTVVSSPSLTVLWIAGERSQNRMVQASPSEAAVMRKQVMAAFFCSSRALFRVQIGSSLLTHRFLRALQTTMDPSLDNTDAILQFLNTHNTKPKVGVRCVGSHTHTYTDGNGVTQTSQIIDFSCAFTQLSPLLRSFGAVFPFPNLTTISPHQMSCLLTASLQLEV